MPATDLVIADPANPATDPGSFASLQLQSLTLPGSPTATAELYDPAASAGTGAYVPYDPADTALLGRATGFRVTLPSLSAKASYRFRTQMLLRPGIDAGARIQNCAAFGTDTQLSEPFCAPLITVLAQTAGAALQKSISPATSVRPQPGLPGAPIQVKLAAQNTGTLWLKRLVVTDTDPAFFDAVDATGTIRVNFLPTQTESRSTPVPAAADPATSPTARAPPARARHCRPE